MRYSFDCQDMISTPGISSDHDKMTFSKDEDSSGISIEVDGKFYSLSENDVSELKRLLSF